MKTKTIVWIIAGAVVAGGCWLLLKPGKKVAAGYETTVAGRGTISNSVTATGTIEPIKQVEVGTQVSGIISKIYVDYNSVVKQGQLLAELDRTLLEAELESSKANLASSKTEFEYQQTNYNRVKGLYDKKLVSDSEYDDAKYAYDKAKSAYDKAKADIIRAQSNLGYTQIYSPIDGVVLSRAVDEGQTVAASLNTPTLFTIANDLTKMQVVADVDEADIGQVKEGQKVSFTVDAYPDDTFSGSVTQVRLLATTTSNVVTYEVVVDAPNPDLKLKPGLTANIVVYTLQRDSVLTLPAKAFRFRPEGKAGSVAQNTEAMLHGNTRTVWIKNGSQMRQAQVHIGITDGISTEVTEGIAEGDTVILSARKAPAAEEAPASSEGSSPFMPKHPGSDKSKDAKK